MVRFLMRALVALAVLAGPAKASDWPTKPVRIVVPYAPGGAADTLGRVFAEVHRDIYDRIRDLDKHAWEVVREAGLAARVDRAKLSTAVRAQSGVPVDVTR